MKIKEYTSKPSQDIEIWVKEKLLKEDYGPGPGQIEELAEQVDRLQDTLARFMAIAVEKGGLSAPELDFILTGDPNSDAIYER